VRWLLPIGLAACATDDTDDGAVDALCDGAPVTTWDNFGAGFLKENCQPCHASTVAVEDRQFAPVAVTFDTEADVWPLADRILARATGDAPTMPPRGGVTDDDRDRLEVWLTCGASS
jgi:uncharacterized membrane protein